MMDVTPELIKEYLGEFLTFIFGGSAVFAIGKYKITKGGKEKDLPKPKDKTEKGKPVHTTCVNISIIKELVKSNETKNIEVLKELQKFTGKLEDLNTKVTNAGAELSKLKTAINTKTDRDTLLNQIKKELNKTCADMLSYSNLESKTLATLIVSGKRKLLEVIEEVFFGFGELKRVNITNIVRTSINELENTVLVTLRTKLDDTKCLTTGILFTEELRKTKIKTYYTTYIEEILILQRDNKITELKKLTLDLFIRIVKEFKLAYEKVPKPNL